MNKQITEQLIEVAGPNVLLIAADKSGAQGMILIRGLISPHIGFLYGAAQQALKFNWSLIVEQVRRTGGDEEVALLMQGFIAGSKASENGNGIVRDPHTGGGES